MNAAYERLLGLVADERCVILDGGVATELQRLRPLRGEPGPDPELWGTWALSRSPDAVQQVHERYVAAGCDVISTDTWSILAAPEPELARLGVRLAREAVADGEAAVAFAISEEVGSANQDRALGAVLHALEDEPPDLLLLETMTLVREPETYETIARLLATGLPVWLSFRRCRHGVCGVYGQHWGQPEGDGFGDAARRFEAMGVGALLINCLPVDHVPGMLSWLRDHTGLPLGVYPNLGHLAGPLWRFDDGTGPEEYAELARAWRSEGAQIVGGCCGTTPEHIAAAARALESTTPGRERPLQQTVASVASDEAQGERADVAVRSWADERGRPLFPLPFPELEIAEGVFVPTQGSFLVWKHLFRTGAGTHERCVDVGCGSGILAIQLALNGAESVHAIDVEPKAVANTLANAERNGVEDRITGETVDLFDWQPVQTFDVVVASLYQLPVDPFDDPPGHRPLDYWGRTLLDHFLRLLPDLLAPGGRAYVMQLSIIGQQETERRLEAAGLSARVADFSFFPFGPLFHASKPQIERVEELSDAYHVEVGGEDVMVAYLLEVTRDSSPAASRLDQA